LQAEERGSLASPDFSGQTPKTEVFSDWEGLDGLVF
jgi:hypothetical protein